MKYLSALILAVLVISSSCNKNTGNRIEHVVLNPTLKFTAFDTVIYSMGMPIPSLSPGTSSASMFLDIDGNGTDDFELNVKSWTDSYGSPSSPGSYNHNGAFLTGTLEKNTISGSLVLSNESFTISYHPVKKFSYDQLISRKRDWFNEVSLKIDFGSTNMYSENVYQYAGLKFKRGWKTAYGWIKYRKSGHHIEISEYGYNLSNKNAIRAGQTE